MVAEYDVQHESAFARDKLGKVIPERLQELLDALNAYGSRVEDWHYGLVSKMLLGLNRACNGLLKTMDEDNLSGAAWNARISCVLTSDALPEDRMICELGATLRRRG